MKKQPEITDATRNTFLQVFCDFYKVRPIEKITVKEITEKAGYSRATFYNYFKDPYDLLEYMENHFIAHVKDSIITRIGSQKTFEEFLAIFAAAINNKDTYGFILFMNPYNTQFSYKFKEVIIPILLDAFKVSPLNKTAVYALEFYTSGIISTLSYWLQDSEKISTAELAALIKNILDDGILGTISQ